MPLRRLREPFDDPRWLVEAKVDAFRAIAFVDRGRCRLVSRNGHVFKSWPSLCTDVAQVVRAESAVLDGELACLG
jgi:bifunctional non-homologous end joining protein LigD